MASFEHLRERLPLLYRPEDDDPAGESFALSPGDIIEFNGQPLPPGSEINSAGLLLVRLNATTPIESFRLGTGRAPGSGYVLALYRLAGRTPQLPAAAFAAVEDGIATVGPGSFKAMAFAVQLRRSSLLALMLKATGSVMDDLARQVQTVMQSHWFNYADQARFNPFFLRQRFLHDPEHSQPALNDPELQTFPYIHDLARMAALLPLPPWLDPARLAESVEAYRARIRMIVDLYRNGVGTVNSLREIVAASLPVDYSLPVPARSQAFLIEEFAPLGTQEVAVLQPGEPDDLVGPLMQWKIINGYLAPAATTLYIQGVEPIPNLTEATTNPVIELYSGGPVARLGIAYQGNLDPNQTLRLRPAYQSWLGRNDGLLTSLAKPESDLEADPAASGPWNAVAGGPDGTISAMVQTPDRSLWVTSNKAGIGNLMRFDGQNWTEVLTDLPPINCLGLDEQTLRVGTEKGLLELPLFPADGNFVPQPAPADLAGSPINAMLLASGVVWWTAVQEGAKATFAFGDAPPGGVQGTPIHALSEDSMGNIYFGGDLGVFHLQPNNGKMYFYVGDQSTEQAPDWLPFTPGGALPNANQVFLPPVLAVFRGPDASLWLGTTRGLARYVARELANNAFDTYLEAFPDLIDEPVTSIVQDERENVLFTTARGLLRFDGRDLWQNVNNAWVTLGQADLFYPAEGSPQNRGSWRFDRAGNRWQRLVGARWENFGDPVRTQSEPAVTAILWTDSVVAELGDWDGEHFSNPQPAPGNLVMRYKPSEDLIVTGGLPAVPRIPVGESTWRYLSLETDNPDLPADRPAWTIEGRLLPPEGEVFPAFAAPPPARYGPPFLFKFLGMPGLDNSVFAFPPAARLHFSWAARQRLSVLVRLVKEKPDEQIDSIVLDRVWQGIQRVRPAGVVTALAVEQQIVRGGQNGTKS